MIQAEVLTKWIGTGAQDDANRPAIGDEFAIHKYEDTTGQPSASLYPDPNLFVAKIECEEAVLAQIAASPDYVILWSEEIVEQPIQSSDALWLPGGKEPFEEVLNA